MSQQEFPQIPQAAADQDFQQLAEPHRRELHIHCYCMLGSVHEAEDLVQETMLKAWRSLHTYAGRASFRAWLYKIATNACLDHLDSRRRGFPTAAYSPADPEQPPRLPMEAFLWLEPLPSADLAQITANPEARYGLRESVRLAFIIALQELPPRQRAILLLRDVLAWRAREVAEFLDSTVSAVNSALHRARKQLRATDYHREAVDLPQQADLDPQIQELLDEYVQAWESADIEQLTALLKTDAALAMPPSPSWFLGQQDIRRFLEIELFAQGAGRWRLEPTQANAQPAFGLYELHPQTSQYHAVGLQVLRLSGPLIADIITFLKPDLLPRFGFKSRIAGAGRI